MRQEKRIIVEGPDGAGKTHLITQLRSRFHYLRVVRNDLGPQQDFDRWWPAVLDEEPDGRTVPIHDRFFYSELVYGPLLRGSIAADPNLMHNVLWFLRMSAYVIYCRPHDFSFNNQPQMEGVIDHHDELVRLYDELMDVERTFYPAGRYTMYDFADAPRALPKLEEALEAYLVSQNSDGSHDAAVVARVRN